jgi:hypothetical protein
VYSSNITPDKEHGIGSYSEEDFDRALRHGIRKDGASLYPAMPYPSYAKVKPADVKALYAYFMQGVQADPAPNRGVDITWPLSMRWPLSVWRKVFAPAVAADGPRTTVPWCVANTWSKAWVTVAPATPRAAWACRRRRCPMTAACSSRVA